MAINWGWGPPIQTWTYASGVAEVDFTNLGLNNRIMIEIEDVRHGSGTPDLWVQVTEDNGASWVSSSGNYVRWGVALTNQSAIVMASAIPTSTATSGMLILNSFNATRKSTLSINGGRDGSASGVKQMGGRVDRAVARNGVRLLWSTSTNIVAGSINIYGMP